jgi:uncharacterized protein
LTPLKIVVIGSGISGLSCAWALSQRHDVTLIEAGDRLGGHTNTVDVPISNGGSVAVDTGFIVHNPKTYPNFVALLDYLDVGFEETEMSFSVSTEGGKFEYSGHSLGHLLGRVPQWISPRHWRMIYDLVRFYRAHQTGVFDEGISLGEYLARNSYSREFVHGHILPIAAAIWSSSPEQMAAYPIGAFVRFFANHNLFALGADRPKWRTVAGGSRSYVDKLEADAKFNKLTGLNVQSVQRLPGHIIVNGSLGYQERFDHVVLATHADQALKLLTEPSLQEISLLQHFKTSSNRAILHRDQGLMPRGRKFWSSWNYLGTREGAVSVTYWMNELQRLRGPENYFVSLNPATEPSAHLTDGTFIYRHPIFNTKTMAAQKELWSLQGEHNTWFCGAWFGAGFHEDGLQAGLAVAEELGGVRRPWSVTDESGRIHLGSRGRLAPEISAIIAR